MESPVLSQNLGERWKPLQSCCPDACFSSPSWQPSVLSLLPGAVGSQFVAKPASSLMLRRLNSVCVGSEAGSTELTMSVSEVSGIKELVQLAAAWFFIGQAR